MKRKEHKFYFPRNTTYFEFFSFVGIIKFEEKKFLTRTCAAF